MIRETIEVVLMQQLKKYLISHGKIYEELTPDELSKESQIFLSDVYPGFKNSPTDIVELMSAPSVENAMQSQGLINNERNTCTFKETNKYGPNKYDYYRKPIFSSGSRTYFPGNGEKLRRSQAKKFCTSIQGFEKGKHISIIRHFHLYPQKEFYLITV